MTDHIRINDVSPRIQYVADGTQTTFTYPFPIFAAADVEVWLDGSRQSSGFSVDGAGNSAGGTVSFASAPAAGLLVTLRRQLVLRRTSDFQADGIIRAKTLNDEFDYQTMALQQVAEEIGRAVKRSATSASTADLTLPEPAAGRSLKWSADTLSLVNSDIDPDQVANQVQIQAQSAAAAATAAQTARTIAETARDGAQTARTAAEAARDQATSYVGGIIRNPILGPDTFTATDAATVFTLRRDLGTGNAIALLVAIDGITQPDCDYGVSGAPLSLAEAPPAGAIIEVRYLGALAVDAALAEAARIDAQAAASTTAAKAAEAAVSAVAAAGSVDTVAQHRFAAEVAAGDAALSAWYADSSLNDATTAATGAATNATAAASSAAQAAISAANAATQAASASANAMATVNAATNTASSATAAAASAIQSAALASAISRGVGPDQLAPNWCAFDTP